MSQSTITFLVLAAVVVVFVWDRIPVAVVAIGTALSLWATGVLDLEQALAGFGDPTVLFIASLFVVSEALEATGVTALVGQALIARVGNDRTRVVVLTMAVVALVTAFITVNASVAALTPVVVLMAVRLRRSPSQLLMPVAFAAHAGSLLALTGTPVNVIISDYAARRRGRALRLLRVRPRRDPLVVGTILIVVLLGQRLLPERTPRAITRDFSGHARTLVEHYGLEDAPGPAAHPRIRRGRGRDPPLSTAMVETGAAGQLADRLVDVVGDAGPHALLLGLFLLTAVLGQLISNMATALIVIPIALSAAADMDVSAKPVLMAVAVSAAAAFLTPVATPANLMVLGPGGYRFGDYWKLGLPLLALFGVVAVLLVPVIWSL